MFEHCFSKLLLTMSTFVRHRLFGLDAARNSGCFNEVTF